MIETFLRFLHSFFSIPFFLFFGVVGFYSLALSFVVCDRVSDRADQSNRPFTSRPILAFFYDCNFVVFRLLGKKQDKYKE